MAVTWITGSICSAGGGFVSFPILPDWMIVSLLALVVSAIFLAFIYIIASVFSNQGLVAFTKYELFEIGATVIIILIVTSFSSVLCSVTMKDIFSNPPPEFENQNLYDASFNYIESVDARLVGWMTITHIFALYMDQLASTTIYAKPLSMGLITSPGAGIGGPIKNWLYQMNNAMAVAFVVNHAQISVLEFAMYGFVNFYFPIGIILRSFTPTRRLGGSIIAIGLGFLIVYPLLTVTSAQMMYDPAKGVDGKIWENFQDPVSNMEGVNSGNMQELKEWMKTTVSKPGEMVDSEGNVKLGSGFSSTNSVETIGSETNSVTDMVWSMFSTAESGVGGFLKGMLYKIFTIPMAAVSMGFVMTIVLPAINILILVQAIKSLSKVFGDEIDISVLTRLV